MYILDASYDHPDLFCDLNSAKLHQNKLDSEWCTCQKKVPQRALAPPFKGWNDLNWAWNETEKRSYSNLQFDEGAPLVESTTNPSKSNCWQILEGKPMQLAIRLRRPALPPVALEDEGLGGWQQNVANV